MGRAESDSGSFDWGAAMSSEALSLDRVLRNIKDPHRWADPETIIKVLEETPSVRGMVYGNFAEVMFADYLIERGVPVEDQLRDDDHAKTKSDRTFKRGGRTYTVQLKSMQTNSIKQGDDGTFSAKIQCDASDKRPVELPNGNRISTTCYKAGEFDVLAVPLQPFTGHWSYAFRLNETLPRTRYRGYDEADRPHLLATLVPITWPLGDDWSSDLFDLLEVAQDRVGKVIIE
jgi:hypothetical protein